MNQKLLEQLALAKQAGTKAMAKDFFAKVPGGDETDEDAIDGGADDAMEGDAAPAGGDAKGDLGGISPEQLQELLRLLGHDGGGVP